MEMTTFNEIVNALTESTPLYKVLAERVAEFSENYTFKVGDVYKHYDGNLFLIIGRTKKSVEVLELKMDCCYDIKKVKKIFLELSDPNIPLFCLKFNPYQSRGFDRDKTLFVFNDEQIMGYRYYKDYTIKRKIKINEIGDEYITTLSKYNPIKASNETHFLKEVDFLIGWGWIECLMNIKNKNKKPNIDIDSKIK